VTKLNFYTNVAVRGDNILLRGIQDNKPFQEKVPYEPYFFSPGKKDGEYKTLYGEAVDKIDFGGIKEAKKWYDENKNEGTLSGVYGMERFEYVFIHDNCHKVIQYDPSLIRIGYLDIEVSTEGGFPDVDVAENTVTAISLRFRGKTWTVGLKDFESDDPKICYVKADSEKHLLKLFLKIWRKANLDVISGYNIEFFDLPYLVKRITVLFDRTEAKKLSPWDILMKKTLFMMGREHEVETPVGIAVLDFLTLYIKFAYTRQGQKSFKESKKLDYVANKELGEKKLDWKKDYSSLTDLYERNHQLYIEYNIHDCYLVDKLNEKLKFIELVFAIAYDAHVNYTDALGSVKLWDVICYNHLMNQKIVIPPAKKRESTRTIMGAYVKEPAPKMYEWIVSFDLTSLYPSLIMGYNISPETYKGKGHEYTVDEQLDGKFLGGFDPSDTPCVAANGHMYQKHTRGFLPAIMEDQFAMRVEYKKKMNEARKAGNEQAAFNYDALQLAKKIQLNSGYGALANPGFRYFDQDLAESITYSGQLAIRWTANKINEFLNNDFYTEDKDYVIASDTDSLYLNFAGLVNLTKAAGLSKEDVITHIDNYIKVRIEPRLDKWYQELATYTNMYKQTLKMNREVIADKGIWVGKKRYILNVLDSEGYRYDKPQLKAIGIEAVRSDTPEICKKGIMHALDIIMNKDEPELKRFYAKFKQHYLSAPFELIATPTGVNNIELYYDDSKLYKKGAPIHVKAALQYNKLLHDKNLLDKYEIIYSGAKIKYCYLRTPNPAHTPVIASLGPLPEEFGLDSFVDRDTQFEKTFVEPLLRITNVINWRLEDVETIESFFTGGSHEGNAGSQESR